MDHNERNDGTLRSTMKETTEHLALLDRPIIQDIYFLQSGLQCQSNKRISFILYCTGEATTHPPTPCYFLKSPLILFQSKSSFNTRWVPSNNIKRYFLEALIYNATCHLKW